MTSNDLSDETNLFPTTIIDEEPELTTDVDLTQINSNSLNYASNFPKGTNPTQ